MTVDTFTDSYGIALVRAIFPPVMAGDRAGVLAAVEATSVAPRAAEFLYYLAGSALWDVAGGQYPPHDVRRGVVADLLAPGSLWAGVFPTGSLELVVDGLSGEQLDVSGVDDDQLVIAFIAVAAHQLPRAPQAWPTWEAHFDYLAEEFTKARATG